MKRILMLTIAMVLALSLVGGVAQGFYCNEVADVWYSKCSTGGYNIRGYSQAQVVGLSASQVQYIETSTSLKFYNGAWHTQASNRTSSCGITYTKLNYVNAYGTYYRTWRVNGNGYVQSTSGATKTDTASANTVIPY